MRVLQVSAGHEEGAEVGPLISPEAKARVERLIQSGPDQVSAHERQCRIAAWQGPCAKSVLLLEQLDGHHVLSARGFCSDFVSLLCEEYQLPARITLQSLLRTPDTVPRTCSLMTAP